MFVLVSDQIIYIINFKNFIMKKTLLIIFALITHIVCYGQEPELASNLKYSNSILNANSIDDKNNEALSIERDPKDGIVVVEQGDNIIFGAYYQPSTTTISFEVSYNHEKLPTNERIKIEQWGNYIRVAIVNARISDSGYYYIKIRNKEESCETRFTVIVREVVPQ